ncbi:hypothetical protein, partial [Wolbachia endosymbiont of Atemnus politus]|uniref:hypothetical protein n=1 Tax=Wolbachia endosymbiont of Atemnus politus TaxID=2682840 RepID=UPI001C55625D
QLLISRISAKPASHRVFLKLASIIEVKYKISRAKKTHDFAFIDFLHFWQKVKTKNSLTTPTNFIIITMKLIIFLLCTD